jgi:hypothetical protein
MGAQRDAGMEVPQVIPRRAVLEECCPGCWVPTSAGYHEESCTALQVCSRCGGRKDILEIQGDLRCDDGGFHLYATESK